MAVNAVVGLWPEVVVWFVFELKGCTGPDVNSMVDLVVDIFLLRWMAATLQEVGDFDHGQELKVDEVNDDLE